MHHQPKSPKPWKKKMRGKGKIPGPRFDVSGRADVTSSKKNCGGLKRPSSSPIPSTSTHVGTTRPRWYQSNNSTHVGSPIASPAKKYKGNGYNQSWTWRPDSKKGKTRGAVGGSKRAKQKRRNSFTPSPQPQRPKFQNQSGPNQGTPPQSIIGQDITNCQWLYYGTYIGNETRTIEFKKGEGCYMKRTFSEQVYIYGSAFLNSGGGSLVVGVRDDGLVCGVHFSHKEEDKTRLQVDWIVSNFDPPLLPHNYSLNFLPVVKPGEEGHNLKVLCLTFKAPPAFTEPTLFQTDQGKVYFRRDGSVQGPLGASVIIEWSRQMWTGKVQQLEQYVHEARSEKWFLVGQVQGLLWSIYRLHRIIASLQLQMQTSRSRRQKRKMKQNLKSSSRQNSRVSSSLPPMGTPDAMASSQHQGPRSTTGIPSTPRHGCENRLRCTQ